MHAEITGCVVVLVTYSDDEKKTTGRAAGGRARAAKMTPEERSESARRSALARHEPVPEAICGSADNPLWIGDVEIECYVLEDETRVITQGSFLQAMGRSRTVRKVSEGEVPPILQGQALQEFITPEVLQRAKPIPFRTPRGAKALGYDANLLLDVCEIFLAARTAKRLPSNQLKTATQAELLVRGWSRVGLAALIDEATGYQQVRTRDALAKILNDFVATEIQRYLTTFPPEFYEEMFRLKNVAPSSSEANRRPQYFGKLTNDIVYSRLAPGVLDELKRVQEKTPAGNSKHKLYQRLTSSTGYPALREHLGSVVTLMKLSEDWDEFKSHLDRMHPAWTADVPLDGLTVPRQRGPRPSRLRPPQPE